LGLIPLAIGINIDFFGLFQNLDAGIYIGGDNVIFWGPLAWTVIYGLIIATFLTLIIVPLLYYIVYRIKFKLRGSSALQGEDAKTINAGDEELGDALKRNELDSQGLKYPLPEGE
jgi:uncharacterized protein (DUF2062 family)